MLEQYYGFIYIWRDKKHKKFYIGRHWGSESDTYVCSSVNMKANCKNRPNDFKRRIIKRVYTKEDLINEEQRYLGMIKLEECGTKYYNKTLRADAPSMFGRRHSKETKEKMSRAHAGRRHTKETKDKLRNINLGKKYSKEVNIKKGKNSRDYSDPGFRQKMSDAAKSRSVETRKKISDNSKRLFAEGRIGMLGKRHSEETIEKMKNAQLLLRLNQ